VDGAETRLLFDLINVFRRQNEAEPLEWSKEAALAALAHSADMLQNEYFGQTDLEGRTPVQRLQSLGLDVGASGEVIAAGHPSLFDAYHQLLNTPESRERLLDPAFTHAGVGVQADRITVDLFAPAASAN